MFGKQFDEVGGGTDASLNNFNSRGDGTAAAVWELRNLGLELVLLGCSSGAHGSADFMDAAHFRKGRISRVDPGNAARNDDKR